MVKQRVYSILVDHLNKWGVSHVFGIPGKSISPLMLELENREIQYVLSRHESGAGYEAAGFALGKRTLGVAIGTSGPGGTNLLTSAAQAKEYQIPVLFLTGHPSAKDTGRALSQESSIFGTDLVKMFDPVTKFSARVDRGDLLPMFLRHALEKAFIGEKGPVHLCIPFDVLMEEIEPFNIPLPKALSVVSPELEKVIPLLDQARKPVLFLGKGAIISEVYDEIRVIAEHWRIPVMTAPGGKGAFPTNHPLCLGGFGLGGSKHAMDYLKSGVDLMIVIGSKLCDMALSGFTPDMYPEKVLQFEHDITFVGKSIPVPTEVVLGDVKNNIQILINKSQASLRDYDPIPLPTQIQATSNDSMMSSVTAIKTLRKCLPEDSIMFGDAGSHSFYAVQHFDIYEPGTFIFDEVFISMGAAIGMSIGAKIANPNRHTVCLTGDGCLLMYGTELSTAVNYEIPVIFFVLNNGRLDMVDKGMSYNTGRSVGAIYDRPLDVTLFANSMGAQAYCCHNQGDIEEAMALALENAGPTVVEVIVDPEEIPPILSRLLSLD